MAAIVAAAIMLAVPSLAFAQQLVALVDGVPITALDLEHRAKFIQMSTNKPPTRQEALDALINEILEVREAKQFQIVISDADVDTQFAAVATRMGVDSQKLTQILERRRRQRGYAQAQAAGGARLE